MKQGIKTFTRKQHLSFAAAANMLAKVYLDIGDKQLAKQWLTAAVQHNKAAMRLASEEQEERENK